MDFKLINIISAAMLCTVTPIVSGCDPVNDKLNISNQTQNKVACYLACDGQEEKAFEYFTSLDEFVSLNEQFKNELFLDSMEQKPFVTYGQNTYEFWINELNRMCPYGKAYMYVLDERFLTYQPNQKKFLIKKIQVDAEYLYKNNWTVHIK